MKEQIFQLKQFSISQNNAAMKITEDAILFGAWICHFFNGEKVLDIGTGTGLLSLMLAQQNCNIQIDAVEKDMLSCKDAEINFFNSIFSKQINLIHSDIFNTNLKDDFYDTIICNPPFFKNQLKSNDKQKNIAWHNNTLPLKELLYFIQTKMNEKGSAFLLLSPLLFQELNLIFGESNLNIEKIISLKSKFQKPAHVFFVKLNFFKTIRIDEEEIIVRDEFNNYTPTIKKITEPFYL